MHIKNMLGIRVPIVSLIVYGDTTDYIQVDNLPSHVIMCKRNALFEKLDEARAQLNSVISNEHIFKVGGTISVCLSV